MLDNGKKLYQVYPNYYHSLLFKPKVHHSFTTSWFPTPGPEDFGGNPAILEIEKLDLSCANFCEESWFLFKEGV